MRLVELALDVDLDADVGQHLAQSQTATFATFGIYQRDA
jgi:hypothetical protein